MLIDEVLTPDSSRFWPADRYAPGTASLASTSSRCVTISTRSARAGRWNGEAPPPTLPEEVVRRTSARYLDAFRRITGNPLTTEST